MCYVSMFEFVENIAWSMCSVYLMLTSLMSFGSQSISWVLSESLDIRVGILEGEDGIVGILEGDFGSLETGILLLDNVGFGEWSPLNEPSTS